MVDRVLIVTDDRTDADALSYILGTARDGPFDIECVTQLSAGLDRLRTGGIDAIIVDLSLPDSTGIATFDRLFAIAPHTPIMTLSEMDDPTLALETIRLGAQGCLLNGNFDSNILPQTLRNVIQRKRVEEALYKETSRAEIALNSIDDAVICTDISGNVDYLNISAEKMTGWPREEARGHPDRRGAPDRSCRDTQNRAKSDRVGVVGGQTEAIECGYDPDPTGRGRSRNQRLRRADS